MTELTQEKLKEVLSYDLLTGDFTWKLPRNGYIKKGQIAGEILRKGYIRISVLKEKHMAHRLAFLYVLGRWPENQVDHINRVTGDNAWINLRDVSGGENVKNKKINIRNKSGFNGVEITKNGTYKASIRVNRKPIYLGTYVDIDDAISARKAANIKYSFHPNHGKIL